MVIVGRGAWNAAMPIFILCRLIAQCRFKLTACYATHTDLCDIVVKCTLSDSYGLNNNNYSLLSVASDDRQVEQNGNQSERKIAAKGGDLLDALQSNGSIGLSRSFYNCTRDGATTIKYYKYSIGISFVGTWLFTWGACAIQVNGFRSIL